MSYINNIEFTEKYKLYYPFVFNFIYRKVKNFNLADDLSQEVFIRFFPKMKEIYTIKPWLIGTSRNVLCNFFRKERKRFEDSSISEIYDSRSITVSTEIHETRIILEEAIDTITGTMDKSIFFLIADQNSSYEKAAKELGLTVRQVKYRYNLVQRNLLDFLKKKGIKEINDL